MFVTSTNISSVFNISGNWAEHHTMATGAAGVSTTDSGQMRAKMVSGEVPPSGVTFTWVYNVTAIGRWK